MISQKIYYSEKLISILFALLVVTFFDYWTALIVMTTLGQAHFVLTYKYKFFSGRTPSPSVAKITFFGLASVALLCMAQAYSSVFGYVAVSLFFLHNFFDEMKLSDARQNIINFVATLPILLSLWIFMYDWIFRQNLSEHTQIFILSLACAAFLCAFFVHRKAYPLYAAMTGMAVSFGISAGLIVTGALYIFFVLTHITNWYIKMGEHFLKINQGLFGTYVRNCLIANGVLFSLLAASFTFPELKPLYNVTLSWEGFAAWSIMHLAVTFRMDDITEIASMKPIEDYKRRAAAA